MKKLSDSEVKRLFTEARRLAGVALNVDSGLPDRSEVTQVACVFIAAGFVVPKSGRPLDRAGADSQQDEMLSNSYGDRS